MTEKTVIAKHGGLALYFCELPEIKSGVDRSSCLKIGTFLVVRKIMKEYNRTAIGATTLALEGEKGR